MNPRRVPQWAIHQHPAYHRIVRTFSPFSGLSIEEREEHACLIVEAVMDAEARPAQPLYTHQEVGA